MVLWLDQRLLWQRSCHETSEKSRRDIRRSLVMTEDCETIGVILPRDKKLNPRSRDLRNNATKQENHLWYDFLKKQKQQFYRQRVIGDYIVEFYCPTLRLVIEVDGAQHYEKGAIEYDTVRTEYLDSLGIMVVRITNKDIDRNFQGVFAVLEDTILSRHETRGLDATAPLPKEP